MTYQHIRFEIGDNGVACITLDRPEKMNSFNAAMHAELRDALDQIQSSSTARVLLLSGAGRGFCAGQDLTDTEVRFVAGESPPDLGDVVERHYKPLMMRLASLRVPTIAAVNGVAAGAGVSLALACDLVIAAESAFFMLPFTRIGLTPDTACSWLVQQRLGQARALGLAITGDKLPAAKAAKWGLIWEMVADDALATHTAALAQQLAAMPTRALVRTRQSMQAGRTNTLEQQLTLESLYMRELGHSSDYVEGVAAFLEKRAPRFTGA